MMVWLLLIYPIQVLVDKSQVWDKGFHCLQVYLNRSRYFDGTHKSISSIKSRKVSSPYRRIMTFWLLILIINRMCLNSNDETHECWNTFLCTNTECWSPSVRFKAQYKSTYIPTFLLTRLNKNHQNKSLIIHKSQKDNKLI